MFLASGESERLGSKSANVFDEERGPKFPRIQGTTERRRRRRRGSKAAFRVPDKRELWPRVKKLGGIEGGSETERERGGRQDGKEEREGGRLLRLRKKNKRGPRRF